METAELDAVITNLEAALKSAHAAQIAALEALRKLSKQVDHSPGGNGWDWELDGSGLEDIPLDIGILTVKETAQLLKVSQDVIYDLVHSRHLPAMRIGNRIRIGRRGLVAYLRGMTADDFDALIKRRVEHVTDADTWTQSCSYAATP